MSMSPKYLWRYVVAIITLLLLPLVVGPYSHFLLATILVYFLVAQSLSLLVGVGGQISIGHAGFWALGAYGSALVVTKLGAPFMVGVLFGGAIAAIFGAIVALPALRVQGHYLAIATLAFALFIQQVLFEWESLSGGREGLLVPRPEIGGVILESDLSYYYFLLPIVVLFAWMSRNFKKSHTGRSLMALNMSAIAGESAGINRSKKIIVVFALSAFFTGVSGALYGHLIGHLSTESFSLTVSLAFLTMAVIGGMGSYAGAALGAIYLTLAPELLREFKGAQMVLYGVTVVLCIRFFPEGLVSLPTRLKSLMPRGKK
jgi:branched-chain amino acid transport system permease protein